MKILHTADWHLGHRLHEQSQFEEQTLFLEWIKQYIIEKEVDVLLIAGDVFDSGSPSNQSLKMYYTFLIGLQGTCCKNIIITGGNHDSPGTLNAPKDILHALSINVVGKATSNIEEEVFEITNKDEKVIIAAVPYLRDGDIRKAVAGESFDDLVDKYKSALINHYEEVANACKRMNTTNAPVIAMGHLFAIGGSISDSEQNIYVGSLGHIGAADFPDYFDYIALGHLHRPQLVGDNEKIRYSGSPHVLSFSEVGYEKKVVLLQINENQITEMLEDTIPSFRTISKISGTINECIAKFSMISSNNYQLKPWVEVVLNEEGLVNTDNLKEKAEESNLEILKISLKTQREQKGIEELIKESKSIKELKPTEVFQLKCEEMNFDLEENEAIWDAFNEILHTVKEE